MRYIVDFDNTLSFATNRDWDNAVPNGKLIAILNRLYDEGNDVCIFTARGHLSCHGDRVLAEETYREGMEQWLSKHNVKYNVLSFAKPLGDFYIDDRAIKPEEFVEQFK